MSRTSLFPYRLIAIATAPELSRPLMSKESRKPKPLPNVKCEDVTLSVYPPDATEVSRFK
jgi:hypothetical protein